MFKTVYDSFLTLIYPQECRICGNSVEKSSDGNACQKCWDKVRILGGDEITCEKCGAYLGESGNSKGVSCRQCIDHLYDKAVAAGIYEFALAATVLDLKSRPHLPRRCKEPLLTAYSRASAEKADMIIPVPLSGKRFHERGYNQAEVIGQFVARRAGIPIKTNILARKVHTPVHRAAMDQKARELTVKNAFEVADKAPLPGARVLLVDDVFTSGATVSNCAKVLKKNGASHVDVLTLARAV
jgi:ComF family protein